MSFKIFGVRIKITYFFSAIICLMLFTDRTGLAMPVLFAIAAHESAHIFAMKKLGVAPKEIELIPGSIKIINPQRFRRKIENIILISGPACNFLLFVVLCAVYRFSGSISFAKWAAVELIIAAFNMLPAKGLDGGSLLFNFLISHFSPVAANIIHVCVSVFVGTFFIVFGVLGTLFGTLNPSISMLGLYIIILTFFK